MTKTPVVAVCGLGRLCSVLLSAGCAPGYGGGKSIDAGYLAGSFIMFSAMLTVVGTLISDILLVGPNPRIRST